MFKVSFFKRKTQNQNKKIHAIKILAGVFLVLAVIIMAVPMLLVKAHQDKQSDDSFGSAWQEVASIVSRNYFADGRVAYGFMI